MIDQPDIEVEIIGTNLKRHFFKILDWKEIYKFVNEVEEYKDFPIKITISISIFENNTLNTYHIKDLNIQELDFNAKLYAETGALWRERGLLKGNNDEMFITIDSFLFNEENVYNSLKSLIIDFKTVFVYKVVPKGMFNREIFIARWKIKNSSFRNLETVYITGRLNIDGIENLTNLKDATISITPLNSECTVYNALSFNGLKECVNLKKLKINAYFKGAIELSNLKPLFTENKFSLESFEYENNYLPANNENELLKNDKLIHKFIKRNPNLDNLFLHLNKFLDVKIIASLNKLNYVHIELLDDCKCINEKYSIKSKKIRIELNKLNAKFIYNIEAHDFLISFGVNKDFSNYSIKTIPKKVTIFGVDFENTTKEDQVLAFKDYFKNKFTSKDCKSIISFLFSVESYNIELVKQMQDSGILDEQAIKLIELFELFYNDNRYSICFNRETKKISRYKFD